MSLNEAIEDAKRELNIGMTLHIHGRNAKGLYHYIKERLPEDYFKGMETLEIGNKKDLEGIPLENLGEGRFIIIDPKDILSGKNITGAYSMSSTFYTERKGTFDIDIAIADATALLYLDVFDAFVKYERAKGPEQVGHYFNTNELIEYSRSRAILEGLVKSVMLKFPQTEIIAARGVKGVEGQQDVRMYELAESIAHSLGITAVKIVPRVEEDPKWKGEYVIREELRGENLRAKKVVVLDDVAMTGKTIESLVSAVSHAQGEYIQTIVLMNRAYSRDDQGRKVLKQIPFVYALTTMDRFKKLKLARDRKNGKH